MPDVTTQYTNLVDRAGDFAEAAQAIRKRIQPTGEWEDCDGAESPHALRTAVVLGDNLEAAPAPRDYLWLKVTCAALVCLALCAVGTTAALQVKALSALSAKPIWIPMVAVGAVGLLLSACLYKRNQLSKELANMPCEFEGNEVLFG